MDGWDPKGVVRQRLLHYSAAPFTGPLKDRTDELGVEMKPHGVWFSVEGEHD